MAKACHRYAVIITRPDGIHEVSSVHRLKRRASKAKAAGRRRSGTAWNWRIRKVGCNDSFDPYSRNPVKRRRR